MIVVNEANAIFSLSRAVLSLPRGRSSAIAVGPDGALRIERLSWARTTLFAASMLARLGICVVLTLWGCDFLMAEIHMNELLLNAVALECATPRVLSPSPTMHHPAACSPRHPHVHLHPMTASTPPFAREEVADPHP
jgi:hypothetical protein